ncbi:hypothetical protein PF008_g23743 [Phytophthora fragariae]|uniref:Uncharacterized protein n=1 Tax=Phytophthora fragariae TaxID=53985 RepID=A0A6G0QPW7_9STRA|nr:hypothetical protein PF008_g23743 [Phytophthora fragariae]
MTSRGVFDASIANDVWSDEDLEEEKAPVGATEADEVSLVEAATASPSLDSQTRATVGGQQPRANTPKAALTSLSRPTSITPKGVVAKSTPRKTASAESTPPQYPSSFLAPLRTIESNGKAGSTRPVGRPKGKKRAPRPTFASPDGPPLERDPENAARDKIEEDRHKNLSNSSNRLGGCDLHILRDNVDVLNPRTDAGNGKRSPSDKPSIGGTFIANKRVRAKTRINEIQKELSLAEQKSAATNNEIMQIMLLMRQETEARADVEERRRRAEREERVEAEKRERSASRCAKMKRWPSRPDNTHGWNSRVKTAKINSNAKLLPLMKHAVDTRSAWTGIAQMQSNATKRCCSSYLPCSRTNRSKGGKDRMRSYIYIKVA